MGENVGFESLKNLLLCFFQGELKARQKTAEQREFLGYEEDKDSCYSESDSYLETSI